MKNTSRRDFFKQSLGAAAVLVSAKVAEATVCRIGHVTAPQTSGPFIPDDFPFRDRNEGAPHIPVAESDADLTRVSGAAGVAQGQIVYLRGKVLDRDCNPVVNAMVYLWQADVHGHYNHQEDPNVDSAEQLDPNFQYRGHVATDASGRFQFKTIKPKYYPLDPSGETMRTAHLHIAVLHPRHRRLVTQIYFEGDVLDDIERIRELNRNDIILSPRGTILPELRELVVEYKRDPRFSDGPVGDVVLRLP